MLLTRALAEAGHPLRISLSSLTVCARRSWSLLTISEASLANYPVVKRKEEVQSEAVTSRALSALKRRLYPHGEMNFWAPARRMGCRTAVNLVSKVK